MEMLRNDGHTHCILLCALYKNIVVIIVVVIELSIRCNLQLGISLDRSLLIEPYNNNCQFNYIIIYVYNMFYIPYYKLSYRSEKEKNCP